MSNSREARLLNRELKELHKDGILEKIYERQDNTKKEQAKKNATTAAATTDDTQSPLQSQESKKSETKAEE